MGDELTHIVTLDWPSQKSSMNSREHWTKRAASQKSQKYIAAILCRHLPRCEHAEDIPVIIIFYPPDKRRRDADNLLSSIKTSLDAIALKMGVDDSKFWPVTLEKEYGDEAGVKIILHY